MHKQGYYYALEMMMVFIPGDVNLATILLDHPPIEDIPKVMNEGLSLIKIMNDGFNLTTLNYLHQNAAPDNMRKSSEPLQTAGHARLHVSMRHTTAELEGLVD